MTPVAHARPSLRKQGINWVHRLLSGEATEADLAELARWRAAKPEHEAAYRDAVQMLRAVQAGAAALREEQGGTAARVDAGADPRTLEPIASNVVLLRPRVSRRMMIGGTIAASVGGVAVLNSSLFGPHPDVATAVGEQKRLALARGLTLVLDTRTKVDISEVGGNKRIALLSGQASVNAALPEARFVEVAAQDGTTRARRAHFDVRDNGDGSICVTCMAGDVEVTRSDQSVQLVANQQVTYAAAGFTPVASVNAGDVSAWQSGKLVFRGRPLRAVIAEVNRYRSGRIIITNDTLANRRVDAVFYIQRMDSVVEQVQQLSGARALPLPAGVVLLS